MFRRTCAQLCSALEVSGVVTNFAGRYPRVKLDDGSYVVVRDSTKFIMRDQRLSLSKDTAEADWQIRDVQKSAGSGGASGALWNNNFAKSGRSGKSIGWDAGRAGPKIH
ncbi:hypothetical protein DIPPA_35859 [Diplonema papillatum]|nr:hypothetical protein DIPPA_35859 [Diplonema papillatum]